MANVTTLACGGSTVVVPGSKPMDIHWEIDIAEAVTAGLATTEYVTVFSFPADTYYKIKQIEVVEALSLGAGARIDVGDAADDDEYVTNATTLTAGTNLTLTSDNEKYQGSAAEIRLKVTGGTIATGKLRFVVEVGSMVRNANATEPTYTN